MNSLYVALAIFMLVFQLHGFSQDQALKPYLRMMHSPSDWTCLGERGAKHGNQASVAAYLPGSQRFWVAWWNFPPRNTVDMYVLAPDGKRLMRKQTLTGTGDGHEFFDVSEPLSKGTYTLGVRTNGKTEEHKVSIE